MQALREDQLRRLCDIARRAGEEVMAVYAASFAITAKGDGSPVTEADLRADRMIRAGLTEHFPGWCIVSEESSPDVAQAANRFFLIDPLDGTKEFVARNGEFTVNIALVEDGRPIAGVVLAPARNELFFAAQRHGAWLEAPGTPAHRIEVAGPRTGPLRVLASRSHGNPRTAAWMAGLARPFDIVIAGSSLKFCRIAQGAADLYPRLGPTSQWDTAAGQAVLEQAGGAVLTADGSPLGYGSDRPLINPNFVALGDPALALPPLE